MLVMRGWAPSCTWCVATSAKNRSGDCICWRKGVTYWDLEDLEGFREEEAIEEEDEEEEEVEDEDEEDDDGSLSSYARLDMLVLDVTKNLN